MKTIMMGLALLLPIAANAVPVTWTLEGVQLGFFHNVPAGLPPQYGFLTGSFVFDADTGLYSDIDISSTISVGYRCAPEIVQACLPRVAPEAFEGKHYDSVATESVYGAPTGLAAYDKSILNGVLDGDTVLLLRFAEALTNAGGTAAITGGWEYYCADTVCYYPTDDLFRLVIVSSFSAGFAPRVVGVVSVPEPTALSLIAIGAIGFIAIRRRRTNSRTVA